MPIYVFKVLDRGIIRDLRDGKVEDLWLDARVDFAAMFVGYNDFGSCKKDEHCRQFLEKYSDSEFIIAAKEPDGEDWKVILPKR